MEQFYTSKTCNTSSITKSDPLSAVGTMGPALCDLESVKDGYLPYHGVLAMIVCSIGAVFNLLNIMVLTHKNMRPNPINLILTSIAVADLLVMLEYISFTRPWRVDAFFTSGCRAAQKASRKDPDWLTMKM